MNIHHLTRQLDLRRIEKQLHEGKLENWSKAPNGVQTTMFAPIIGTDLVAVIKPDLPSHRNGGFNTDIARRDEAAYVLDGALGLRMVPPTVQREVIAAEGNFHASAQLMVEGATDPGHIPHVTGAEIRSAAALDILAHAVDRHGGNWLSQRCDECDTSHIVLIDNSWSFNWQHHVAARVKEHRVLVELANARYGGPDREVLERAVDDPHVAEAVAGVLDEQLVERMLRRARHRLAA